MSSEPILLKTQQYLFLLEGLIRKKLDGEEIDIGISYRGANHFSVISFDDYDQGNSNLHLYCSVKLQFSLEVCTTDDEGDVKSRKIKLSPEDMLLIPEGLRRLMEKAAAKGKGAVFKAGQIRC